MAGDKYQKLKLQYSHNGTYWADVEPPQYKMGDLIEENSPDCGGVQKIYRWYALPDEYICDGYNKYYKEVYQVSTDEGFTWKNVSPEQSRTGQLIENNSIDCGYGITWELVQDEYICELGISPYKDMDIVLYDKNNDSLVIVSDYDTGKYPSNLYTQIGTVVIPGEHNVYGDGSCAAVATNIIATCVFGNSYIYSSYNELPIITFTKCMSTAIGEGDYAYGDMPIDKEVGKSCPCNDKLYYGESVNSPLPPPFLSDKSKNDVFFSTIVTNPDASYYEQQIKNVFTQMNGKELTKQLAKDIDSSELKYNNMQQNPAATYCNLYSTVGTQKGDWYLPSIGELAYLSSNYSYFNRFISNGYMWSCSYHSSDEVFGINFGYDEFSIHPATRNALNFSVLPFIRIKNNQIIR